MTTYHGISTSGQVDFTLYIQMSGIMQTTPPWFSHSTAFLENTPLCWTTQWGLKDNVTSCMGCSKILLTSPPDSALSPLQTTVIQKHRLQALSYLLKTLAWLQVFTEACSCCIGLSQEGLQELINCSCSFPLCV